MTYEILTTATVGHYIKNTPALYQLVGDSAVEITEIGDGNLNYVFLVKSEEITIILKQAVPYLRCAGSDWELSRHRILFESNALQKFYALMPQHVPVVYHVNPEMSLLAMQYLATHTVVRKAMIARKYYPYLAEHMATFLAHTLFKTSSLYLSSTAKRSLEQEFDTNHDLCTLSEEFIFTFPYIEHPSNYSSSTLATYAQIIRDNHALKMHILDLKYCFMNQRDALLHGDLHTGSIMANENETYVIDPEFAFFGPFGFDIGAFAANLILAYVSHYIDNPGSNYATWLLTIIEEFLEKFLEKFLKLWGTHSNSGLLTPNYLPIGAFEQYQQKIIRQILQQSIGFAGCKMLRRILGIAGVADIRDIANPHKRLAAEKLSLEMGSQLVINHRAISQPSDVLQLITTCHE